MTFSNIWKCTSDLRCLRCVGANIWPTGPTTIQSRYVTYYPTIWINKLRGTVKAVLRDHYHESTCLDRPHIFGRRTYISLLLNLSPETAYPDRQHYCGQWCGLSRQGLLHSVVDSDIL